MSPIYQRGDSWYFELYGAEHGPYTSKHDAEVAYCNQLRISCPHCEE